MYMLDTESFADGPRVGLTLDERSVRALHSACDYTLNKWAGEGIMDQEEIINLKTFLQGAIFEFQLHK